MPRCDRCKFFLPHPPAEHPDQIVFSVRGVRGGGECRVQSPVAHKGKALGSFPVVANDCWCGRFEQQ